MPGRRFIFLLVVCLIGLYLGIWGHNTNVTVHAIAEPAVNSAEQIIKQMVKKKEKAVNKKDKERFLSVLHPERKIYIQEQKRWFDDAIQTIDPGSFHLKVKSIAPDRENVVRVLIDQSYKKEGKEYHVEYSLIFERTKMGWKDADLVFYQITDNLMVVRYTHPSLQNQAYIALDTLKKAAFNFKQKYQWTPEYVEVKLYHQPEVFRQSVKLSLPQWAGGWHEAGESIKFIGGNTDMRAFASGMVHEFTHQMVSELTNDNASYWLQEGAAMYYEAHLLPGLHDDKLIQIKQKPVPFSLTKLEKSNLEELPDREAVQYYLASYQLFRFIVDQYGEERIQELFALLQSSPNIDQDSSEKLQKINQRTRDAIKQSLGLTVEELDKEWRSNNEKSIDSNRIGMLYLSSSLMRQYVSLRNE